MIGQTISHYRILEKLGEGGMGIVYKAEDIKLKRTVALKFLPKGLEAHEPERARFLQEAQAAAALNHPNICTIHDIAIEGEQQFIVMEYIDGQTLRQLVTRNPKPVPPENGGMHKTQNLKPETVISYAIQIGEALQEAHSKGIIHRDVKTDNIMVNSKNQVKVMDFGLAKLKGAMKLTKTSSTVGTLAYMAPEHIEGQETDARSDIFSFGVVLYEMLTGHLPFRGEHDAAMMYSIVNEEPQPLQTYLPDAPSELLHVVNRALEKDPEDRYQTVRDMVIDLRRLKKETTRVVRPPAPSEGDIGPSQSHSQSLIARKWFRPTAVGGGSLLAMTLLYFLAWPPVSSWLFPAERIPIAVITFENQTGDPQYDYLRAAIPNLLVTSLEQSSGLRVTTWERMRDLLKQMGRKDVEWVDADLGFELCRKDSVQALVLGSFVKMGDMFATDVKVIDVESKQLLKSASSKGEGVGSILQIQIDELGREIATGIGLPESRVALEQKAIAEVTSSSLEAYNFYLRGVQEYEKMYFGDARHFLEKAVSLDSTFAMAHLYLGRVYAMDGDVRSRTAYRQAFTFSNKVTRKEKLFIDAAYAEVTEGDREKQYRILKQLESEYPREKEVHYRLYFCGGNDSFSELQQAVALDPMYGLAVNQLAYEYSFRGDYENALRWFKRYTSISPGDANPYDSMGELYFLMGSLGESVRNFKLALELKPDFESYSKIAYVYALSENYDEAKKWIGRLPLKSQPLISDFRGRFWKSFYARWLGRNSEALSGIEETLELSKDQATSGQRAGMELIRVAIFVDRGQFDRAQSDCDEIITLMRTSFPEFSAFSDLFTRLCKLHQARIRLIEGQLQPVENVLAETDPVIQKIPEGAKDWLPFALHQTRGELLLTQGKTDQAIIHFKESPDLPQQFLSWSEFVGYYNLLFPRDMLARALMQKGDLDSAIAEYERITNLALAGEDRRLVDPLHRYKLGKLYEKKGLKDKAIAQYERFLQLWEKADTDRPEPKDARARLARLR